jgi:hypothetical protein
MKFGCGYITLEEGEFKGPIAKFLTEEQKTELCELCGIKEGDSLFFISDAPAVINKLAGEMRTWIANELGLIQSYAAAGSTYYYQDGVFYIMDADGQYSVIVPPAGALVETLPEDYDLVTLADGNQYYVVDYTVYKVTVVEGKPYFEVLGQLYTKDEKTL